MGVRKNAEWEKCYLYTIIKIYFDRLLALSFFQKVVMWGSIQENVNFASRRRQALLKNMSVLTVNYFREFEDEEKGKGKG